MPAGNRYPENFWYGGLAPRVGFAYRLNDKTVVRAGYGLFYTQAFYPGWGGGISLDGFNPLVNFGDSLSGYQPAFFLDNGFPAYSKAPNVSTTADNGTNGPTRPKDANKLPTRSSGTDSGAQVRQQHRQRLHAASKGTHLPSAMHPEYNPSLCPWAAS
jgi:hypothetical protein